jgi:ketosteroid isomerase-like protein
MINVRSLAIVICVLFIAVPSFGQTAKDGNELTRLLNEFLAGASVNDAKVHDRFWADDLIYTRSAGVRTNKPALMENVRKAPAPKPDDPKTTYTAEDIQIHQYGETAVVAFTLVASTIKGTSTDISHYLNTGTFVKRSGRWQVVAWQSTAVPKSQSSQP